MAMLLQMVLWVYLYNSKIELGAPIQVAFYLLSMFVSMGIAYFEPHIGNFTPWLLFQYVLYIMLSVTLLTERFGFTKALCLGFLIVYFNSFYWELFYHVREFQSWLPYSLGWEWWRLRIPQWLRVVPAYFLLKWFEIKNRWWIMLGLTLSYGLTYLRFNYLWASHIILPAHRIICLALLVYTIWISPKRAKV